MAERDPQRPQLDFPALVAELITQLRLTGQVGLLDFSDVVTPVFLIGSRGINFAGDLPTFGSASTASGSIFNPAADVVIVDTGPLPAGIYDVSSNMSFAASTALASTAFVLEHRNAANTATLASLITLSITNVVLASTDTLQRVGYELGVNERLRIKTPNQVAAGGFAGVIFFNRRPTP